MRLHRFYITNMHNRFGPISMGEVVWIHDEKLLHQWVRVLRFRLGDELILFNDEEERLYKIAVIEEGSIKLTMMTELSRNLPTKQVYLFWSILKKDKNDWVIQKATELGVHKLVPIYSERNERQGFNEERARKIIIEAAEQSGRTDIPAIREPIELNEAINEYVTKMPLLICEQHESNQLSISGVDKLGVLIGPEGGWSDTEKELFKQHSLNHINISQFTLRAETAAIVAVAKLMSG